MREVRVSRTALRRFAAGLPALALVGVGSALAVTGGDTTREIAQSEPLVTVPDLPALQEGVTAVPPLPPLPAAPTDVSGSSVPVVSSEAAANGIPARALQAYKRAATLVGAADPTCKIDWALVAAIGKVESNHGRYGGNGIGSDGTVKPGIFGIPLDGSNGTALIRDTDAGAMDRDRTWDRAVGPMQFIPGTWKVVGVDANQDGVADPQNLDDAATATAVYLCSGPGDLTDPSTLTSAIKRYNNSDEYARTVIAIAEGYRNGFSVLAAQGLTAAQSQGTPYLPTGAPAGAGTGSGATGTEPGTKPAKPKPTKPATGGSTGNGSGGTGQTPGGGQGGGGTTPSPSPTASGGGLLGAVGDTVGGVVGGVGTIVGGVVSPRPSTTTTTPAPTRTTARPTPTPSPTETCIINILGIKVCTPLLPAP